MNHTQFTVTDFLIILAIASCLYLSAVGVKKLMAKYYWSNVIITSLVIILMLFCAVYFYKTGQYHSIFFGLIFFIWAIVRLLKEIKIIQLKQQTNKPD